MGKLLQIHLKFPQNGEMKNCSAGGKSLIFDDLMPKVIGGKIEEYLIHTIYRSGSGAYP
jgi:hypothetical protein